MQRDRCRTGSTVLLRLLTAIAVFSVLAVNAQAQVKSERAVLSIVNGDSIFTSDIDAVFAKMHSAMSTADKGAFDYHKLLNKLVNDRLIVQEAEALGIDDDEYVTRLLYERKQNWVRNVYIRNNFIPDTTVSDKSVMKYFAENYHKVRVRTLSVEGKAQADSLAQQIRQGTPMDSLAKLYSVDMFKYVGGFQSMKYWITVEEELRRHLNDAGSGELIGPFPYRAVYCIMRVEETAPADTAELAGMRGYIEAMLRDTKKLDEWNKLVQNLGDKYGLEVDSSAMTEIARSTASVLDSTFQRGSDRPVAKFSGTPVVSELELRQETAHSAMSQATTAIDTLLYKSLNKLVEDQLLYRAGLESKLDTLSSINRRLESTKDSVLIEVYLKETVASRIKFNHDEFQQYYDENQDKFREPDQLTLRQVLIDGQERADSSVALLKDGADFDYVADKFRKGAKEMAEQSIDASMDAFPKSIQADLAKLTPGQSSNAYPTSEGWVIFKVLDRKQGRLKTLEEVDINIREVMFQRKFSTLLDETLAQLKASSEIVMFDEAIEKYLGAEN